jgi:hypothetical protein
MRLALLLVIASFACSACTESATFSGAGNYVVSPPGGTSHTVALEQSGLICANMIERWVLIRLSEQCVLKATPTAAHYAYVAASQSCTFTSIEGARSIRVRGGTLFAGFNEGVRLTLDAEMADAPDTLVTVDITAPAPRNDGDACEKLRSETHG